MVTRFVYVGVRIQFSPFARCVDIQVLWLWYSENSSNVIQYFSAILWLIWLPTVIVSGAMRRGKIQERWPETVFGLRKRARKARVDQRISGKRNHSPAWLLHRGGPMPAEVTPGNLNDKPRLPVDSSVLQFPFKGTFFDSFSNLCLQKEPSK